MYSTRHILRFFLLCIVTQGRVSKATNLYISRASGNDSWSCVQTKPCRTIWQGVSLALDGTTIYLDGTNTDQDPYSCHSAQHSGVYINKSLALIGIGPMLPQIRCSEGTRITFDGSVNTHQMNVTFSGLLVRESFVFFQDTSASIYGCKFVGSKQGVQFVIKRKIVSDFLITNSVFERNEECISIFVNSTKIESPIININFSLKNSSMFNNTIVDGGNHVSFTESSDNNQTVNCLISMESVTFEGNKFNSRGLVFLQLKSGNQGLQLHEVKSSDNWPSTNKDVLKDRQGDSEFILNSTYVDIFINASRFTSQNARELGVTASNTSIKIYNSRFNDHRVEGAGGALSVKGHNECRLFISKSIFCNTTAYNNVKTNSAGGGGAIDVECAKLRCTLKNSIFLANKAVYGYGGAVNLHVSSSFLYDFAKASDKKGLMALSIENVTVSNCNATYGGSLSFVKVEENPLGVVINISNSHFISNVGRAILLSSSADEMLSNIPVMIRGSTFANNAAKWGEGVIFIQSKNSVFLEKTVIESNRGGGIVVGASSPSIKVLSCTFTNNTGVAVLITDLRILEINDTLFVRGFGAALYTNIGTNCKHVNIKYTTFKESEYYGVAVQIDECNGKMEIRNSNFLDNVSPLVVEETSSLLIQDSIFKQTRNMNYSNSSSLIEVVNLGNLVLSNTTVAAEAYSRDKVLMRVNSGNKVSLGNNSFPTKFICPFGSKIDIDCFRGIPWFDHDPCTGYIDGRITAIKFKCTACEGNSYSLQGGQANGSQVVSSVKCHPCPFGADCSQNIVAKRNFWGFKEQRNPSLLRFIMCPVGYCSKAPEADFPEFNSCQGNRSGQLCGKCEEKLCGDTLLYAVYTISSV